MTRPACPGCGCALDSGVAVAQPAVAPAWRPSGRTRTAMRAALALFALAMLLASSRYGLARAGVPGALIAAGGSAFLLLPFLPERYAPGRSRG
jgi:hypothetical protein